MDAINEQMQDLVRRLVIAAEPLRIILFGSSAHGDAVTRSDIDVLVVVPDCIHRRETARNIYRGLEGFPIPVDVVVATVSDIDLYKDSPGLVYREALREGKELYAT